MKEFYVQYDRVNRDCNTVASFDTLQESIDYVNEATKGMQIAEGDVDNDQATACRYVVITLKKDSDAEPEPVEHYSTPYYWE